jgi:hypothetical protein
MKPRKNVSKLQMCIHKAEHFGYDFICASPLCRFSNEWLIFHCFTCHSGIFYSYRDVAIADEGLQNLGLWLSSRKGSLSCYTFCDTGPRFFRSHQKDRLLRHASEWRGPILTRTLTGLHHWMQQNANTNVFLTKSYIILVVSTNQ